MNKTDRKQVLGKEWSAEEIAAQQELLFSEYAGNHKLAAIRQAAFHFLTDGDTADAAE